MQFVLPKSSESPVISIYFRKGLIMKQFTVTKILVLSSWCKQDLGTNFFQS